MAPRSKPHKTARPPKPEPRREPAQSEDEVLRALASASPEELYQIEKRRRAAGRMTPGDERLAAAKREFEAMLAAEAGTPRGGRPRKKPVQQKTEDDDFDAVEEHPEQQQPGDEEE